MMNGIVPLVLVIALLKSSRQSLSRQSQRRVEK